MLGPDHRGRSGHQLSEFPFLVSSQVSIEGFTDPGTPRELGDDLHS